jgi:biotin carboxylase
VVERILHKTNTLLVLGASADQIFGIISAKSEGYRVLAIDINSNSPGFKFADEYAIISTRDLENIFQLCNDSMLRGFPISGVLVMGTDIPHIAQSICEFLKIRGVSKETAKWTTNKFLMKEQLSKNGVKVPWYSSPSCFNKFLLQIKEHESEKFVIKPVDRSGARGVFLIEKNTKNLKDLYYKARDESYTGQVILEEFIEGDQISTETIIYEGKSYTPGFVDRNYEMLEIFKPNIIENGGIHPSKYHGEIKNKVLKLVSNAALSLGIKEGVAKGDIVISKKGEPMIIEMGARLSGGDFSESLIPLGCGVNIVSQASRIVMGDKPDLSKLNDQYQNFVANRYFFGKQGKLKKINGLKEIKEYKWIKKFELYVKVGDEIEKIEYHGNRLGVFVVVASNRNELLYRIELVYSTVQFEIF